MPGSRSRKLLASIVAIALALAIPTGASAATTIGSPLISPNTGGTCGTTQTTINATLASGTRQAPFDGFIVRWRLSLAVPGGSHHYSLRVLHPNGGTSFTGVATGPPQTAPAAGVNVLTLPSPLAIRAGDVLGINCEAGAPSAFSNAAPTATSITNISPPIADGATASGNGPFPHDESLVNADIAVKPSNAFTLGAVTRNKRKGTATVTVDVPGPGTLSLTGSGVNAQQAADQVARKTVSAAGTVNMLVKPRGRKKSKLKKKGKAKVNVTVTYTPSGEIAGDPNTQSTTVRLVRKR
jgi:hypothetical protein